MPRDTSFANVPGTGLGCAERAPEDAKCRADTLAALEPRVEAALRYANGFPDPQWRKRLAAHLRTELDALH